MSEDFPRWSVRHQRLITYDLIETSRIFDPQNRALCSLGREEGGRRFVVIDRNVALYYASQLQDYFVQHGIEARIVYFDGGERHKRLNGYLEILHELDAFPIRRRDEPIIAIGGGVLTDVVGFVASTYRRGIPHIKVPTTLMGYVDASVGIKTAINFNGHKNRLGSFEPPLQVLLDPEFLGTLPHRHILNGVCEILKLAIIKDAGLFQLLEQYGVESVDHQFQNRAGRVILQCAISSMLEELEPNLFEDHLTRRVDFGHTFSHGIESRNEDRLLHGEAVLLDIAVSTLIAKQRSLLGKQEAERIFRLIDLLNLPIEVHLLDTDLLWEALLERVEHRNGKQRSPVPDSIGSCVFLNDISRQEIESSIAILGNWVCVHREPAFEY